MDRSDVEMERDGRETLGQNRSSALQVQLRAVMKIRRKYLSRNPAHNSAQNSANSPAHSPAHSPARRRKRRRPSVMFPNRKKLLPKNRGRSRTQTVLIIFISILFLQVYNAIENLDDEVEQYDLEVLERTLQWVVFGQQEALELLMSHLSDYLSTYVHRGPLVVSLHGASGVGKSLLGRVLVQHFHPLVLQHRCPPQEDPETCASALLRLVTEVVTRAEEVEKVPLVILDEVELLPPPALDLLQALTRPDQDNQFLNVVYVLLGSLGQAEITAHFLRNASIQGAEPLLRHALSKLHPLWADPGVELIPLALLERRHVAQCFQEEMTAEGFYPDSAHVERLAGELAYHRAGGREYAKSGCKQVVAKVNQL